MFKSANDYARAIEARHHEQAPGDGNLRRSSTREFCHHGIGWKRAKNSDHDAYHVIVYQFGGSTSTGAIPVGGQWKCWDVNGLSNLAVRPGEWHTAIVTRQGTCIDPDRIELEVAH